MFDTEGVALSAEGEFSIEHLLPWLDKLTHIYQEQEPENYLELPTNTKYPQSYFIKKIN